MDVLSTSRRWGRAIPVIAVTAILGIAALWYFTARQPSMPQRALRIGFENNPPVQIRTENGFSGLAVEAVNEASKRAGIKLEWVETGTSSDEAFRKGLVDLWPLMVDLPDRRKRVYFPKAWMHSRDVLMVPDGSPDADGRFKGSIAVLKMPLHVRLAQETFPEAHVVQLPNVEEIMSQICKKGADAGFLEERMAWTLLRDKSRECPSMVFRVQTIPGLVFNAGLASTFESAGAADRIQSEIDNMFRNGMLAGLIAKYSYFGLDDTWASYDQMEAAKKLRWFSWAIVALVFTLGLVLWQASSLRQRKRAEVALRESEQRFRNLANTAPVMIAVSGPDGRATFFNKVWLDFTGRTMEQELDSGWIEALHPEDRERVLIEYSASLQRGTNCNLEYRLRRADGEYRNILCTGVPRYKGNQGNRCFDGFIASCVDLTDIKRSEEEARARHNLESLGVLAGGIAHDFNNLLGGALAYVELAEAQVADGASPLEELQQIRAVAIHGSEVVRQLMIFAGKEGASPEHLDVSSVVRRMLDLIKVSISKHAVLRTTLGENLPAVTGNAAQILQVVINLITNASEAIGENEGVIHVITERATSSNVLRVEDLRKGPYVRIEVADTGSGIAPENLHRLFDPFFTTKFAGRGMGLAVVQGIVQRHGGTIHVVSSPGQGTRVEILLPCTGGMVPVDDSIAAASLESRESTPTTKRNILVVEDELPLLSAVSKMLERSGFCVNQARDGSSALELLQAPRNQIDALLLDVTLPGLSSREILLAAQRLRPDLQVILTSAYSQESIAATFSGLRFAHFIRKPFAFVDLVSLLRSTPAA
jgi:PAS domain S-box-containing protein